MGKIKTNKIPQVILSSSTPLSQLTIMIIILKLITIGDGFEFNFAIAGGYELDMSRESKTLKSDQIYQALISSVE